MINDITILKSAKESKAKLPLSVSKVKTFSDCRAKYNYSYIKKLPRKEWEHFKFGLFVHEILESFHKELLTNQDQPRNELMTKCFRASLDKWAEKLSRESKIEAKEIMKIYLAYLKKLKDSGKMFEVSSLERPFYIDIGEHILLNGFIDRIQIDHDGIIHVADYKTTKKKQYVKNDFFQLMTYAFVLMAENPDLDKIRTSYIMLRHNFDHITKEFTREDIADVPNMFLKYADEIKKERLWRPSPTFLCSYCDFLDVCNEGKAFLVKRGIIKLSTFGAAEW